MESYSLTGCSDSRKAAAAMLGRFLDTADAPVSFTYGGRSSRDLLPQWRVTRTAVSESDRTLHTVTYADPDTGVELVADIREYKDFPAIEWTLRFRNAGAANTPILENVQVLDYTVDVPALEAVVLHRLMGCTSTISDFAPVTDIIVPGFKSRIAPIGGRSSNYAMPFFNLELPGNRGILVAIGWTGQWAAELARPYFKDSLHSEGNSVSVRTGMGRTRLTLLPGETIRTPQSLVLFWEGDQNSAHNQFRRLVLRHKTPHIGGKPVELPIAACGWFQFRSGNEYTEENQIAFARLYRKRGLDVDTFWVDAGWFEGGWPHGVGSWFPRKEAFPNGFRKLSEVVHGLGMKFLVWFGPERVAAGSWLHREHPEWLLSHADGANAWYVVRPSPRNYLLDLGNPAARKWLTDHVSQMIEDAHIDIYRHDANIDPLDYWPLADAPDRQGITEIRYIEGLYAYWEELKRRHPGLLVECCCSGNRRFDLETISRTINLWRSDYTFHPAADQCQTYGISHFIQLSANGCKAVDAYGFRSLLEPAMCLCWDPRSDDFPVEQARSNIALFKRVRPYFSGDYYPLTPYSTRENVWLAYQFHRYDLDEGVVLAFRRPSCTLSGVSVQLGGVTRGATYEVEDVDTGRLTVHQGAELADLRVTAAPQPAAVVLIYRRLA
jgi:alpha-galactosidase